MTAPEASAPGHPSVLIVGGDFYIVTHDYAGSTSEQVTIRQLLDDGEIVVCGYIPHSELLTGLPIPDARWRLEWLAGERRPVIDLRTGAAAMYRRGGLPPWTLVQVLSWQVA